MADSAETWGGLTAVELGVLIGGVGLAIIIIIILVNIAIHRSCSKGRSPKGKGDEQGLVMQTERTVNGQNMQQVIMKSQPNGNMDKYNQSDMPYQTMDSETTTVRYDTGANQSPPPAPETQPEEVVLTFRDSHGSASKVVITETEADSGTGDSPVRASAVDVHSETLEQQAAAPAQGNTNNAYESDDEAPDMPTPYYSVPPPPESMPPPLTPGIPVTDLDADDTFFIPPPPPVPADNNIYAEINKNRSVYRPSSEIQIIEREKF